MVVDEGPVNGLMISREFLETGCAASRLSPLIPDSTTVLRIPFPCLDLSRDLCLLKVSCVSQWHSAQTSANGLVGGGGARSGLILRSMLHRAHHLISIDSLVSPLGPFLFFLFLDFFCFSHHDIRSVSVSFFIFFGSASHSMYSTWYEVMWLGRWPGKSSIRTPRDTGREKEREKRGRDLHVSFGVIRAKPLFATLGVERKSPASALLNDATAKKPLILLHFPS